MVLSLKQTEDWIKKIIKIKKKGDNKMGTYKNATKKRYMEFQNQTATKIAWIPIISQEERVSLQK